MIKGREGKRTFNSMQKNGMGLVASKLLPYWGIHRRYKGGGTGLRKKKSVYRFKSPSKEFGPHDARLKPSDPDCKSCEITACSGWGRLILFEEGACTHQISKEKRSY